MAKENKTKYAILGVLNIRPASGYDIKKFCDQSINHFWNENYGHIYPVLKQMEGDGWISRKVDATGNRPNKNVFSVTPEGKKVLLEWLKTPPDTPQARYEFLLKVFFSDQIAVESILGWLRESRTFCKSLMLEYQGIEQEIRGKMDDLGPAGEHLFFRLATVRFGIFNMRATIDWCDEVINHLESKEEKA